MSFVKGITPIVRGACDRCGHSRNLFVPELLEDVVPCNHRDLGCQGNYQVVFRGPKALLPSEFHNVNCRCRSASGAGSTSAASGVAFAEDERLATLVGMGFPEAAAVEALQRCATIEEAVDWLTDGDHQQAAACSESQAPSHPDQEFGECPICMEQLLLGDAAMRCAGPCGKKHYFHAHCLGAWIRQCQSDGNGTTCPECRGDVQIRPRRLQEFLEDKGNKLDEEEQQAWLSFQDATSGAMDENGWADVRRDLWKAGAVLAIGAGLALAVAGIGAAMASRGSGNQNGNGRGSGRK